MTDPRYVNNLADIYTEMYNPSGKERPLTEAHSEDHDYDIPKWKRLLNQHAQKEKLHRGQHPVVIEPREDASEDEEASTAELAMMYIRMLIDEAETDASAAGALAEIRDLVKYARF